MSDSTSNTPEQWAGFAKIVKQFYSKPDAGTLFFILLLFFFFFDKSSFFIYSSLLFLEPFREPVDYQALGLIDYPQIIKTPMDLGTIQKKLESNQYPNILKAADDVRLVWNNCMTYNADGSDFHLLAQALSKKWNDKYTKFCTEFGIRAPPVLQENQLSLEEKREFARNLYKLSKEDLGKVLVELEATCPPCMIKNSAEDEFELNVDKISESAFSQVNEFIQSVLSSNKKNKKAKKSK
jgi:hypothetical protein